MFKIVAANIFTDYSVLCR